MALLLLSDTELQVPNPLLDLYREEPLHRPHDVKLPDDAAVHPPALRGMGRGGESVYSFT